jgi:protein required for attachment to host cells
MVYRKSEDLPQRPNKAWVVVAESFAAKVYSLEDERLEEVTRLETRQPRGEDTHTFSDRAGRSFDSLGAGRHAMEPPHTAREQVREAFALELAHYLKSQAANFKTLLIYAPPKMIGTIRAAIGDDLSSVDARLIDKDYFKAGTDELAEIANAELQAS